MIYIHIALWYKCTNKMVHYKLLTPSLKIVTTLVKWMEIQIQELQSACVKMKWYGYQLSSVVSSDIDR